MTAIISKDGKYRYWLERKLASDAKNHCVFIMLNPSTADANVDDPTIRRCKGFADRFGCGKLVVVNLFAFRATDPRELYKAGAPIGEENDKYILKALALPGIVICGWGAHNTSERDNIIKDWASNADVNLMCLGKTKSGAPKHPLYLPALAPLTVL